jgi:sulfite exporter TauE/SafE
LSDLDPLHWTMVLLASIAGSLHCAAMCGGLSLAAGGGSLSSQWAYHVSRGGVYILLGAWAGQTGQAWFSNWEWRPLQWISMVMLLGVLVLLRVFGSRLATSLAQRGFRRKSAILIGLSSVFLPCSWLYSYVFLAGASGSGRVGAGLMLAFWLGTLPALLGTRILLQGILAKLGIRSHRAATLLMVLAATQSLWFHWHHIHSNQPGSESNPVCGGGSTHQDGANRQDQSQ